MAPTPVPFESPLLPTGFDLVLSWLPSLLIGGLGQFIVIFLAVLAALMVWDRGRRKRGEP
jgi:hypothetical protein